MQNTNLAYITTEAALNPLELLPLARGAHWRYSYAYSYYWVGQSSGTVRINRYGWFDLSVIRETPHWDGKKYTVRAAVDISNRHSGQDTYGSGRSSEKINRIKSHMDYEVALVRGSLWYDRGTELEFMMPAAFANNGHLDLRLFNFPGVAGYPGRYDFFSRLLGPGRFGAGNYIYRASRPVAGLDTRTAVFSAANEGPLRLKSRTRRRTDSEVLEESLELELQDRSPGRLAW
jgi:hypothetical protein